MMKYFCFLIALIISTQLFAQDIPACNVQDTPNPFWTAEDQRLIIRNHANNASARDVIDIPVWLHIMGRDDGSGMIAEEVIYEAVDKANIGLENANIQLSVCGVSTILNTDYYNFDISGIISDVGASDVIAAEYNYSNTVNIYFSSEIFYCGYTKFPWREQDYIVMNNACVDNGSTLVHEVGHYLGLWHTHNTVEGAELVNGSNCEVAGDFFCDTPADPNLSGNVDYDTCIYQGDDVDENGDTYTPDTKNYMSYSTKACRVKFSPEQNIMMNFIAQEDRSYLSCDISSSELPDIAITRAEVPERVLQEEPFLVSCVQRLSGRGEGMYGTEVAFYLSENQTLDDTDLYLGMSTSWLTALEVLEQEAKTVSVPQNFEDGIYYILFVADHGEEIEEASEDNNVVFKEFIVGDVMEVNLSTADVVTNFCEINLSWTIEHEYYLSHYELESSLDNESFTLVQAFEGGQELPFTYQYSTRLETHKKYYRLKLIAEDGTIEYRAIATAEIDDNCLSSDIQLFPNPLVKGESTHLNLLNIRAYEEYDVIDIHGRRYPLDNFNIVAYNTIDLVVDVGHLSAGVYFLKHHKNKHNIKRFVIL